MFSGLVCDQTGRTDIMKIFAVNGSPRMKNGMTHILTDLFLEGAVEAGAEVESVFLQKKKIGYCLGCFKCWVATPGRCVQKDDMAELLEKMTDADYFLIGTPIYLDGMSAQTKTFLDRIVPVADPHLQIIDGHYRHQLLVDKLPEVVLLSVCGGYEMDNFEPLVDQVTRICRTLQTRFVGSVLRPVSYILEMDKAMPEGVAAIKAAIRQAGRELVERGAFVPETLDQVAENYLDSETFLNAVNQFWDACVAAGKVVKM